MVQVRTEGELVVLRPRVEVLYLWEALLVQAQPAVALWVG